MRPLAQTLPPTTTVIERRPRSARQTRFSPAGLHFEISPVSAAEPSWCGPRHEGHSARLAPPPAAGGAAAAAAARKPHSPAITARSNFGIRTTGIGGRGVLVTCAL